MSAYVPLRRVSNAIDECCSFNLAPIRANYSDLEILSECLCRCLTSLYGCRAGRYEVDGYVYNAAEEPKILMTGKWNEGMSYQPCDMEGEPLPGTELKEVNFQG